MTNLKRDDSYFMYKKIKQNQKGMGALFIVIILGAAALIMIKSVGLLSVGELELGTLHDKSGELAYLADGCVEEAMRRIQLDETYNAVNESLEINGKNCIINTTNNADEWIIEVQGEIADYRKQITVNADYIDGVFSINTWE